LTWFSFKTENSVAKITSPVIVNPYDGRSVLQLDAIKDPSPVNETLVVFQTYGDFGKLSDIQNFNIDFKTLSSAAVPRFGLLVDSIDPESELLNINQTFYTTPGTLQNNSGVSVDTWNNISISLDNGDLWVLDAQTDAQTGISSRGVIVGVNNSSTQRIELTGYTGAPLTLDQSLSEWFNNPTLGAALQDAKIKGIEISFNAYDPQASAQDVRSYVDKISLTNAAGETLINEDWTVNDVIDEEGVYIDKNTFYVGNRPDFLPVQNIAGFSPDASSSFLISLPGLEDTSYLSWGVWGSNLTASDGSTDRAFGFYAIGDYASRSTLTDMESFVSNFPSLAAQDIVYRGAALGAVFGGGASGQIVSGTASLTVNFTSGNVSGSVNLPQDVINLNAGSINRLESFARDSLIFRGGTTMNNANFVGGAYEGQFYGTGSNFAVEAAGTFSGSDGVRSAVGAFGIKQ